MVRELSENAVAKDTGIMTILWELKFNIAYEGFCLCLQDPIEAIVLLNVSISTS